MGRISQRSKKRAEKEFNIYFKSMKTAVEFLENELSEYLHYCIINSIDKDTRFIKIDALKLKGFLNKAKAMEKEQIMDAYNQGCNDYDELGYKKIEQYYNETYKNTNDEPTI